MNSCGQGRQIDMQKNMVFNYRKKRRGLDCGEGKSVESRTQDRIWFKSVVIDVLETAAGCVWESRLNYVRLLSR